ncbi:MAG: hypothetical protein KDJ38_05945 [Gammaproteobacteria bacterium]|nr:hypothetical protein [Gammaproteobacteria bacterium]
MRPVASGMSMNPQQTLTQQDGLGPPRQQQTADWYALRLLSNYRLFLLICITALFYLNPHPTVLGQKDSSLFHGTLISYLVAAVMFNHLIRIEKPDPDTQFYLQAYIDIICITLMMYASGGIQSGFGILLVANIAIIGIFTPARYTFLFAAIATTAVMTQEIYTNISSSTANTSLIKTGLTGMALFAVAYITSVVIQRRFPYQGEEERLRKDIFRAVELNQRIIQQMDSGIIVIDEQWQVKLINDSAALLLGLEQSPRKKVLSELSPQLQTAFLEWKRSPLAGVKAFKNPRSDNELLPHFSPLGNHGTLISLEDYGQIAQQVQQLKLASLGGLTASIAHEIRNPLAAISNAVQLVNENETIGAEDRHLLDIAERHCQRINHIIEDILQLSRREKNNPQDIEVASFVSEFAHRFKEQQPGKGVCITSESMPGIHIEFDRSHLEQILTNLCLNAITHNPEKADLHIILRSGISEPRHLPFIEIADNGKGIEKKTGSDIFEPFYTTTHNGTGLGLFIIRELCEINNAQINLMPAERGACFRIQIGRTAGTH